MKTVQMKAAFTKMVVTNHKIEWLKPYSKFNDVKELDRDFARSMSEMKEKFNKLQHKILYCVRQHAAVVPGVANASYRTYIEYIEEKIGHTVSVDTIRNTIDKAEKEGLLLKIEGQRLNKSQAANVIVFNRYEEVVAYRVAAEEKERKELEKRLEEEYKANKEVLNWSHEAKSIAAARIQKKKEQQQQKQQAAEQKPQTLYQKMRNLYKPNNESKQKRFRELVAIVYGSLKRYKGELGLPHNILETTLLNAFKVMLNKENVENEAAMLSVIIRKQMENLKSPRQNVENAPKNKEVVPQWFNKYQLEKRAHKPNTSDLECVLEEDFERMKKEAEERLNTL